MLKRPTLVMVPSLHPHVHQYRIMSSVVYIIHPFKYLTMTIHHLKITTNLKAGITMTELTLNGVGCWQNQYFLKYVDW